MQLLLLRARGREQRGRFRDGTRRLELHEQTAPFAVQLRLI
jgi:hypothetical protein